jgi:hypothetical protein
MKLLTILVACATLAVVPAFADGTFLVKYMTNLNIGDGVINISNTGTSSGQNLSTSGGTLPSNGNICVNVYVFSPDEQEQECCSCLLTPNALAFFTKSGLTTNTLTGFALTDAVIKLVATSSCIPQANGDCFPTSLAAACNPSTAGRDGGQPLATGLVAWGTALHANTSTRPVTYQVTETHFTQGTLSTGELNRITNLCSFIQQNGSGAGICKGCAFGGQ